MFRRSPNHLSLSDGVKPCSVISSKQVIFTWLSWEVLDQNHAKQFQPISTPAKFVFYSCLHTIAVIAFLLDSSWGLMAGQLQPATATAGVPACIKMIKHPALQLPNCSWDFAAVESYHEKYIQCCNSVSVLFRPTICLVSWREMSSIDLILPFFSFPGCNPFLLSVSGDFQCSGIDNHPSWHQPLRTTR